MAHAVGVEEVRLRLHPGLHPVAQAVEEGQRRQVVQVRERREHLAVALRGEARGRLRLGVEAVDEVEEARVAVHPLVPARRVRPAADPPRRVDEEGAQAEERLDVALAAVEPQEVRILFR